MKRRAIEVTREENKLKRDKAIKARFQELYNERRMRYDDVIKLLAEEFFISQATVGNALRAAGEYQRNREGELPFAEDCPI